MSSCQKPLEPLPHTLKEPCGSHARMLQARKRGTIGSYRRWDIRVVARLTLSSPLLIVRLHANVGAASRTPVTRRGRTSPTLRVPFTNAVYTLQSRLLVCSMPSLPADDGLGANRRPRHGVHPDEAPR